MRWTRLNSHSLTKYKCVELKHSRTHWVRYTQAQSGAELKYSAYPILYVFNLPVIKNSFETKNELVDTRY